MNRLLFGFNKNIFTLIRDQAKDEAISRCIERGVDMDSAIDVHGTKYDPVAYAVKCGHVFAARELIKHGGHIDRMIHRPIDLALWSIKDRKTRHVMVDLLLEAGVDPNKRSPLRMLPLSQAVQQKDIELVDKFLSKGALLQNEGGDALRRAIETHNPEMVLHLLDKGASPNQDDVRCSPLMTAVFTNQPSVAKLLLERGANVNALDGLALLESLKQDNIGVDERTPSGISKVSKLTEVLLEAGADPNISDGAPLKMSLFNPLAAQTLFSHGASLTPEIYDMAKKSGCQDTIAVMEAKRLEEIVMRHLPQAQSKGISPTPLPCIPSRRQRL